MAEATQRGMTTKFRCTVCGNLSRGRKPPRVDGSERFPAFHHDDTQRVCAGVYTYAEWVDVPV